MRPDHLKLLYLYRRIPDFVCNGIVASRRTAAIRYVDQYETRIQPSTNDTE